MSMITSAIPVRPNAPDQRSAAWDGWASNRYGPAGGVQPGAAARGAGHADASLLLRELPAGDAEQAPAAGVPRPVRGALRERQRRHPLEKARLGERLQRLHRRVRGAGGDRRRRVGRVLRAVAPWTLA